MFCKRLVIGYILFGLFNSVKVLPVIEPIFVSRLNFISSPTVPEAVKELEGKFQISDTVPYEPVAEPVFTNAPKSTSDISGIITLPVLFTLFVWLEVTSNLTLSVGGIYTVPKRFASTDVPYLTLFINGISIKPVYWSAVPYTDPDLTSFTGG